MPRISDLVMAHSAIQRQAGSRRRSSPDQDTRTLNGRSLVSPLGDGMPQPGKSEGRQRSGAVAKG